MKFFRGLILASLASACLYGQAFYWNSASARSIALGGNYVPSASGVLDALTVNPAGLAVVSAPTLDLSFAAVLSRGSFSNSVNQNSPLNNGSGLVPYGAFGMRIGHSPFTFGIGAVPELTSVANWNYVDAPGVAGASYGFQRQKSAILAARSVAGLGVDLGKALSVGVSVGLDYNSNALEAPYIFQIQPVVKGLKTLLDLHTHGLGWNTSVGALVRPSRSVMIQAAWKSRTVVDSTGSASGDLSQQFAALGIAAPSAWHYSAAVHNVLPQSVVAGIHWRVDPRWTVAVQGDWINWARAFQSLPVALTNGTNAVVNGLLNSTSLNDAVPLNWKNQISLHAGFERTLGENLSIRGGYAHANSPVPSSTLSPLTAAIFTHQITTGLGYRWGRANFDLAYAFAPTASQRVTQSALLSGEYNNSLVRVGTQTIVLSTEFRF